MPKGIRTISAAAAFVLLTFLAFHKVVLNIGTHINGTPDDAYAIFWYLWWFKHSIMELNAFPSFTDFVESPFGVGLTNTTIINHVLALPLTYLSGPIASYNLMILLSFALAGFGMYLLAYEITGGFIASIFAGAVYAFSPYHVAFSSTGGMDGAQVQYMPFALFFMLRYGRDGGAKNLLFFFLFLAFSMLSFGYYAALVMLAVAVYFLFMKALPFILCFINKNRFEGAHPAALLVFSAAVLIVASILLSSLETVHSAMATSVYVATALTAAVIAYSYRAGVLNLIVTLRDRYRSLGGAERLVLQAGAAALFVFAIFFLLPVYSLAARNISDSYIAPAFSYFLPPVDHPLLGKYLPKRFVPSPDPFIGQMVYVGAGLTVFALAGLLVCLKKTASKEAQYIAILFLAGLMLLPPPHLKVGDLDLYTPVYWFHKVFPPFVDIRRAIVLVILAGSVLAGVSIKYLQDRAGKGFSKAVVLALIFAVAFVEYYPKVRLSDVGRVPLAYAWLASRPGDFTIIEYPLTSIYDSRRYQVFLGQTMHHKKIMNTFGAAGQEAGPSNERLNEIIGGNGPANEFFTSPDNAAAALASLGVKYVVMRTDKTRAAVKPSTFGAYTEAVSFPDSRVLELNETRQKAFVATSGFYRPGYFLNYLEKGSKRYSVKNPYIRPELSWSEGGPWLWMEKSVEFSIVQKEKAVEGWYDLRFIAKPAGEKEAVLEVKDDDGNVNKFIIMPGEREYVITGLRVKPFDRKRLTLTVEDGGLVDAPGDFWEKRGHGGVAKVSIGIKDLRAVESRPDNEEIKPGIISYEGVFAGGV